MCLECIHVPYDQGLTFGFASVQLAVLQTINIASGISFGSKLCCSYATSLVPHWSNPDIFSLTGGMFTFFIIILHYLITKSKQIKTTTRTILYYCKCCCLG